MASIDINKLIQESMTSTMEDGTEVVVENAAGEVTEPTINEKLAEALTEGRDPSTREQPLGGDEDSLKQKLKEKAGKAGAFIKDKAEDAGKAVGKGVKAAGAAAGDAIKDNPKSAMLGAASTGLLGAGVMAKKAMAKKK